MCLVLRLTSLSENITEAISQNVKHKLMGEGQQRTEEREGKDRAWEKHNENNTMTTNTTILLFQFTCYFREIVILYA